MLIDWFTVVAQLFNFAILVIALKYLLYDRLIEAMEKRRRSIAEQQGAAEERRQEAEDKSQQLEKELRQLDTRRDEILDDARREAKEKRKQLLREVREDVEKQEQEWRESIRSRQDRLLTDLQRLTGEKAVAISRRLLRDLADESMETTLIEGFVKRFRNLQDHQTRAINQALRSEGSTPLIRSAFELSEESRKQIEEVLADLAGDPGHDITWEHEPDLIAGIVLQVGAQTIEWTMSGYLDDLNREFADLLHLEFREGRSESNGWNDPDARQDGAEGADGRRREENEGT